jgi:3-ketosteroid 9alpha-monooxygenase subunit B
MPVPAPARGGPASTTRAGTPPGPSTRDHGFHRVRVARVVAETDDAGSFVLDVPDELRDAFAYDAGQFCTFRVVVDGQRLLRCYSMSSAPNLDDELQVTVKRVQGGAVSNWLLDNVDVGDELEVTCPAGVFTLAPDESELVAFAAGSGITPVVSLMKTALASTSRPVRLLYANRDTDSVILAAELDALAVRHHDQLDITHRLDVDHGFVDSDAIRAYVGSPSSGTGYYLCGPASFMDIVEEALLAVGVDPSRIHLERFTPVDPADPGGAAPDVADDSAVTKVTIDLDGRSETTDHHPGTTILQTARQLGMTPPFSCESGSCATCMARLVEGSATMEVNNALTDDEVDEGWLLTCQAVPSSPAVHVVYGFEGA